MTKFGVVTQVGRNMFLVISHRGGILPFPKFLGPPTRVVS